MYAPLAVFNLRGSHAAAQLSTGISCARNKTKERKCNQVRRHVFAGGTLTCEAHSIYLNESSFFSANTPGKRCKRVEEGNDVAYKYDKRGALHRAGALRFPSRGHMQGQYQGKSAFVDQATRILTLPF